MTTVDLEDLDHSAMNLVIKMMRVFISKGLPSGELEEGVHWEYDMDNEFIYLTNDEWKTFILDGENLKAVDKSSI